MTPRQIRNDLQNALDLMADAGICLAVGNVLYERHDVTVRITWKQSGFTLARPQHFGTLEQYKSIIRDGSYSGILLDGSLLRLSYTFERNNLKYHNLWYYPCPIFGH